MGKNWFFKAESFCCWSRLWAQIMPRNLNENVCPWIRFGFSMCWSRSYSSIHKNQKSLLECKQQPNGISKIWKHFQSLIFFIYRRCHWHQWLTLTFDCLHEFSKKLEMVPMVYSGLRRTLIHEDEISWQAPFMYWTVQYINIHKWNVSECFVALLVGGQRCFYNICVLVIHISAIYVTWTCPSAKQVFNWYIGNKNSNTKFMDWIEK